MTALDPSTADRVLDIPDGDLGPTGIPFGDATFAAPSADGGSVPFQKAELTEHGFYAYPRDKNAQPNDVAFLVTTAFAPADDWTLMVAFDNADGKTTVDPWVFATWGSIVGTSEDIFDVKAGATDLVAESTPLPAPLTAAPVVLFLTANQAESFWGTSRDGVLATGAGTDGASSSAISFYEGASGYGGLRLLGMWMWEGQALSQIDAADTAGAIAATLAGGSLEPPPLGAPSTVGPSYTSRAAQAILGPAHSMVIPEVLWGGWLDADGELIAMTGLPVAHDDFGPASNAVVNSVTVDAGLAPAVTPTRFGLFDAASGGDLVIYAEISFDEPPVEDEPQSFAPGTLAFVISPAGFEPED